MENTEIDLKWNTFRDHLGDMLHMMIKSNEYTDVTLVCDGMKQIKARKIVLTACSPVFRHIIKNNPHPFPMIYLRGVSFEILNSLIKFMYLGESSISKNEIDNFLKIASDFQIKELMSNGNFVMRSSNIENITNSKIEEVDVNDDDSLNKDSAHEVNQGTSNENINRHQSDDGQEQSYEGDEDTSNRSNKKCRYCHATFSQKSSVKRHIKNVHPGKRYNFMTRFKKNIQCKYCDTKFSQRGSMKMHVQNIHEGKKYNCDKCERTYSNSGAFYRHKKEKHN